MCIEVYKLFADCDCQHKEYQNTFRCEFAKEDQLLEEPISLPAERPNFLPGLSGCTVRKAIRPTTGKCRRCRKRLLSEKNQPATVLSSNPVLPAEQWRPASEKV
ncbi:hypothetical protein EV127DRAFT_169406 [Xylaria flabelliformis]|nr:hypothetical protein EV127DRAFT_169406 [Xylaria flabelliformis]